MKTNRLPQALFVIGERLIYLVPQLTTIILISRFWGHERFGEYALVLTWARTFQAITGFGITECLAREIGREPGRSSSYFTHGLALLVGLAVVGVACMTSAACAMRYPSHVTLAILVVSATLLPTGVIAACRGVLVARGRIQYMIGVGLVESAILLSLNVYWIVNGAALLPLIAIMVFANMVSALLTLALVHARVTPFAGPFNPALLRQLWRNLLPLGISSIIIFPSIRFDIILLSKMATFGELGFYSAASKIPEFLFIFTMAFYLPMLPRVTGDLAQRPEPRTDGLRSALAWYFAFVIPVGVGILALASPIILFIYGPTFAAAAPLLRIQMVTFVIFAIDVALMLVCKAAGFLRADLAFVAASTALNVSACFLLIPRLGAAGAALAVAASVLLGLILRWRLITRLVLRLEWISLIRAPLFASVLVTAAMLLLGGHLPLPLLAVGFTAAYAAIAIAFFAFVNTAVKRVLHQLRVGTR